MQETFSIKQAEKSKEEKPKSEPKAEVDQEQDIPAAEEVQATIEEFEEEHLERNKKGLRRLKSFREMDIEERLDYLAYFPKKLPPVPCLFQTKTKEIRGTLMEKTEEQVVIKLFDKTEIALPINDLIAIRMIGL